jgi:iron-sulfur cluster repair protein YtfE (RIC family)
MNALELLKSDHRVVAGLFKQARSVDAKQQPPIFAKIKAELDTHAHIEETIFYPKLQAEGNKELVDIVLEGIEEHRQVKMFLKELDALTSDSEKFEPKLKVLMEDVEHHVEEEEGEMFPLIEKQFKTDVLEKLGAELQAEKQTFQKSTGANAAKGSGR